MRKAISGKTVKNLIEKDLDTAATLSKIQEIEKNIIDNDKNALDVLKAFIGK